MTHQSDQTDGSGITEQWNQPALYDLSSAVSGGREDHERTETTEKIAANQEQSYCKRERAGENGTRRAGSGSWVVIE